MVLILQLSTKNIALYPCTSYKIAYIFPKLAHLPNFFTHGLSSADKFVHVVYAQDANHGYQEYFKQNICSLNASEITEDVYINLIGLPVSYLCKITSEPLEALFNGALQG
jgi:hypothetical protein